MDKNQISIIKNRLNEVVSECGTQTIFAEKIGYSTATVSNWLNHAMKSLPDVDTFIKIANDYGKSTDWLLAMDNSSGEVGSLNMKTMSDTFRVIVALVDREDKLGTKDYLGFDLYRKNHLPADRTFYNHMGGVGHILSSYYDDSATCISIADSGCSDPSDNDHLTHKRLYLTQMVVRYFTESLIKMNNFDDPDVLGIVGDIREQWLSKVLEESKNYNLYGEKIDPDGASCKLIDDCIKDESRLFDGEFQNIKV